MIEYELVTYMCIECDPKHKEEIEMAFAEAIVDICERYKAHAGGGFTLCPIEDR